jgi:flagellar biogenesis protein FliO
VPLVHYANPFMTAPTVGARGRRVNRVIRFFIVVLKNLLTGVRSINCKRKPRSMRLRETLPLGDRKYLALVEVDGHRFLVGAAGNSLSLLARLSLPAETSEVLSREEDDVHFDVEAFKAWR